jgi:type II secretion system protein L
MNQQLLYLHDDNSVDCLTETNHLPYIELHLDWSKISAINEKNNIVIVPGHHITIHQVMVPNTSRAKLTRIIPFAVEEQIIDTPDACHFAFDKVNDNGLLPTAITKKTIMQHWLTELQQHHIHTKTMLPDYLAIPYENDVWYVYLINNRALIRIHADYGLSVNIEQLPIMLILKLQEEFIKPTAIKVHYDNANKDYDASQLANLNITINLSDKPINAMELFLQGINQTTQINLLQGDFSLANTQHNNHRIWKITKYLAMACVTLWVLTSIGKYAYYQHQLSQLETQTKKLYLQVFPNASDIVEPQLRIQRLAQNLEAAKAGGNFLSLLANAGQQIQNQNNAMHIVGLRFNDNALELDVTANSFQTLETFTQQLKHKTINAQQSNARTTNNGVSAKITLTRGLK